MLEEEAAKLVGLAKDNAAETPTACLRPRPGLRLGSLNPAAPPSEPCATAMEPATVQTIKEAVDTELRNGPQPSMKPLLFTDKSGSWSGSGRNDNRQQSSTLYGLETRLGEAVDKALRADAHFGAVFTSSKLQLEMMVVIEKGGPWPQARARIGVLVPAMVIVSCAQPVHRDLSEVSTTHRLPRCAIPVIVLIPLDEEFLLGYFDPGTNSTVDLVCKTPVVMAGDELHYGAAQSARNRRLHIVFTNGEFNLASNAVRAGDAHCARE